MCQGSPRRYVPCGHMARGREWLVKGLRRALLCGIRPFYSTQNGRMPGSPRWHVPSGGVRLGVCFSGWTGKVVALQGCNSGKCSRGCGPLGGWTLARSRAPFAPLCRRGSAEWRELYRLRLLVSILLLQLAECQGSAIWQVLLVDRHLRRGSLRVGVFGLRLIRFCKHGGSELSFPGTSAEA